METETAQALLAGFLSGAATAFATVAVGLAAIARSEGWRRYAARGRRVPLPLLGIVLVNGAMLGWTALGLLLGAAYLRAEASHPASGLASANWLFTVLVAAGAALVFLLAWFIRGRVPRPLGVMLLLATAAFGWLLPGLAR